MDSEKKNANTFDIVTKMPNLKSWYDNFEWATFSRLAYHDRMRH